MKQILFSALLIMLFFSCRKKEITPLDGPVINGSEQPGAKGLLQPSTGGDLCDLKTYYGYVDYHGNVSVDSSAWVRFYKDSMDLSNNVNGGTVTLNGTPLIYDNVSGSYVSVASMSLNIAGNLSWNVSGSGTVTAFTQSFTPSYPKYTGGSLLPDTCYKSNGIAVNINGVSDHAGGVAVMLMSSGASTQYKYLPGSTGTCTFSPQEIAAFNVNQPITIYISIDNKYTAIIGGIKRGFSNSLFYKKMSYLKP